MAFSRIREATLSTADEPWEALVTSEPVAPRTPRRCHSNVMAIALFVSLMR
jgi:hypothetical protein